MPLPPFSDFLTTTSINIDGYDVVQTYGVVRGIVVRSRSVFGPGRRKVPDALRRQHHASRGAVRDDPGRGVLQGRRACSCAGRQRAHRYTLRRHRDHARCVRGPLLRDGRSRRPALARPKRKVDALVKGELEPTTVASGWSSSLALRRRRHHKLGARRSGSPTLRTEGPRMSERAKEARAIRRRSVRAQEDQRSTEQASQRCRREVGEGTAQFVEPAHPSRILAGTVIARGIEVGRDLSGDGDVAVLTAKRRRHGRPNSLVRAAAVPSLELARTTQEAGRASWHVRSATPTFARHLRWSPPLPRSTNALRTTEVHAPRPRRGCSSRSPRWPRRPRRRHRRSRSSASSRASSRPTSWGRRAGSTTAPTP